MENLKIKLLEQNKEYDKLFEIMKEAEDKVDGEEEFVIAINKEVEEENNKMKSENDYCFSVCIVLYVFLTIFNLSIISLSNIVIESGRMTKDEIKSHLYIYILGYTLLQTSILGEFAFFGAVILSRFCKMITLREERLIYSGAVYLWFLNGGACTLIGPYWCYLGITRGQLSMGPF